MKKLYILPWLLASILPSQAQDFPQSQAQNFPQNQAQDFSQSQAMSQAQDFPQHSIVYNDLPPKHEVRAVWLTTIGGIDWPHSYSQSPLSAKKQQAELCRILDELQQAKINTVLIQTRIRATTIYPSDMEPWDGCLSGFPGKTPGYDALQFAIDECHKRGMELHAWVVTIPVGKWDALGCKTLRQKMPRLIKKIGADGYMNPEDSRTGDYLARMCGEIASRYNIDGIHLDYIRYPETWKIKVSREQGRKYITSIVRKIHDAVKQAKPWIKMSCSPVGKYDDLSRYWSHGWNANTTVCQDAQGWLKEGLMDELFPMMYFRGDNFYPFAIDWQEQSHGKTIAPGLGIYFLDPKEGKWKIDDVTPEMYHTRNTGMGYCFFRNKFLLDNKQGILDFTRQFNEYPSLVPPMTWASQQQPQQPQTISIEQEGAYVRLHWNNPTAYTDGTPIQTPYIYNNVYASRKYPVDVSDARNLISARHLGNELLLRGDGLSLSHDGLSLSYDGLSQRGDEGETQLYFAVTSMDGYGNESAATQQGSSLGDPNKGKQGAAKVLYCDNQSLHLPHIAKKVDGDDFWIETLQDCVVMRTKSNHNRIDISHLADGAYRLVSINQRGVKHTIGTFYKKKMKEN